ncbi:TPA: hypothetical protein ACSJUJ_000120 [Legionella pneumophila]|uniref:hypothetical protein n=1 Tax=Legionella TaxID=445 RepID=UPI0010214F8F|nr:MULTISPECIES: hypothetical protein [Legionella]MCO1453708.1 hypothetical protein [Legionella pneumophila]MDC8030488.1 hypothetical protein [Legionella pneumophila subsp. pneumophila]MDI0458109.1 hypothetical protein [Legionella pneumophila]MDI0462682.1 hypothetical protein [Legionella pneumophila]MDI2025513.1 hypothetical protein [Legionella pneumophila]
MDDKKLILDAANRYGFNLEFRTKKVLEEKNFSVLMNQLMKSGDEFVEIDIRAAQYTGREWLIECKGSSDSSHLILIKEDSSNDPKSYNTKRHAIQDSNYRIAQFKPDENQYFFTFTGDFFNKTGQQLKKISKNDSENNFFKAQYQILSAIKAISLTDTDKDKSKDFPIIIPMIVTNAKIWVIDYNKSSEPGVSQHKWVLHKVKIKNNLFIAPKYEIEYDSISILVLNIDYLDEFLGCYSYNINGEITIGNSELAK